MTFFDTISDTFWTLIWPRSLYKEIEELDAQIDVQDKVHHGLMSVLEANSMDPRERAEVVLVRTAATSRYTSGMLKEPFSLEDTRDVRAEYLRELTAINQDLRRRIEERGLAAEGNTVTGKD